VAKELENHTVLNSVPDIDMLDRLHKLLDGLFKVQSDGKHEIRRAADSRLAVFLRQMKATDHVDLARNTDGERSLFHDGGAHYTSGTL
jgi:hypothetical protein